MNVKAPSSPQPQPFRPSAKPLRRIADWRCLRFELVDRLSAVKDAQAGRAPVPAAPAEADPGAAASCD
jgi:hypothetical protein